MKFLLLAINRFKIFILIFLSLLIFLFLFNLYLGSKELNSNIIKGFEDKWLSKLSLTEPGISDKLREFIKTNNFAMLDFCLRNASSSKLCYEADNDNVEFFEFEELDKFYAKKKLISNKIKNKGTLLSDEMIWLKENRIIESRHYYYGKSSIENFFYPFLRGSDSFNNNRVKILVIGDSFAYGNGLYDVKESWPSELERALNKKEDKFEVFTLAASGANYTDFFRYLSSEQTKKIDPDIIFVSLHGNDFNYYSPDLQFIFDKKFNRAGLSNDILSFIKCRNGDYGFSRYIKRIPFFENIKDASLLYYCDNNKYYENYIKNPFFQIESKYNYINLEDIYDKYSELANLYPGKIYFINFITKNSLNNQDIIIDKLVKKGVNILNKFTADEIFENNLLECNKFEINDCIRANPYDYHYNLYFMRAFIEKNIDDIYDKVKDIKAYKRDRDSSNLISEVLPYHIRYKVIDNRYEIISYDSRSSFDLKFPNNEELYQSLCAFENRNYIRINLNENIINNKKIKVNLLFSESNLLIKNTGFNSDGSRSSGDYIAFDKDNPFTFVGGEDKNSIVIALDRERCYNELWGLGLVKVAIEVLD